MPSTREIRRRIVSVKKTAQITSAMEKVAQAKMGRAQQAATAGRPYAELMNRVLGEVVTHAGDFDHPFMKARGGENRALILVTTDKGMCGSINSNLLRKVNDEFVTDHTRVIAAGRKGAQHATRVGWDLTADFSYSDTPVFAEARAIARMAVELFENAEVDHVDIAFTNFINTLSQKPEVQTLLPITEIKGVQAGVEGEEMASELSGGTAPKDIDGISIVPELLGEKAAGRKQPQHQYLYWEIGGQTAVRMQTWKAIQPGKKSKWQLYDLSSDISEQHDLAMTSARPTGPADGTSPVRRRAAAGREQAVTGDVGGVIKKQNIKKQNITKTYSKPTIIKNMQL